MDNVGSSHLLKLKKKKKKEEKKKGPNDDISPSSAFVAHRGWLKKAKRTKGPIINTKEKRGRREVKKDKTNRARRRVKAKRSDVDLEFLTREFHPRIVPVEEERVQSDIKKGQFSFLQVDALVTPGVD